MRIFVLSHKPPYPIVDGSCLAMSRLIADLSQLEFIDHIEYWTLSTHKHPYNEQAFKNIQGSNIHFRAFEIDTRIKVLPALYCLLTRKSYHTKRFLNSEVSAELRKYFNEQNDDIVIFESLFTAIYAPVIRSLFHGKMYYRSHNIEYKIWEDLAKNTRNLLKKWYLNTLSSSLKRKELKTCASVNTILSISKDDVDFLRKKTSTPVLYLPSSMEKISKDFHLDSSMHRLCFLGAFDWKPNVEAVEWLIKEILPPLLDEFPSIELHIAGRKSALLAEMEIPSAVKIHGFVDNPIEFISKNGLFVAGLRSGSGVKMKVLDAMNSGVPVVLTEKAAEGIPLEQGIPVHHSTESFLEDIRKLLNNPEERKLRGRLGQQSMRANFSPDYIQSILRKELASDL